ncbi:TPR-like protein [Penicillium chrysogenum]|nr:TPR-like protein [Penicillium chrysogenum]
MPSSFSDDFFHTPIIYVIKISQGAFYGLENLYYDQGKLKEAEEIYQRVVVVTLGLSIRLRSTTLVLSIRLRRALAGYKKALGPDYTSTLSTVGNLGNFNYNQSNLKEAEEMY